MTLFTRHGWLTRRVFIAFLFALAPGAVCATSADTIVNWAAAANGGIASTSTTASTSNYPAASLNDGDRTGKTWGIGGGWQGTAASGDYAQIAFAATQTIDTVSVYSLQDNYSQGADPSESATFTKLGLAAFDVQAQSGTTWTTVASVTGNQLVKRTVSFAPVSAAAIRIVCNTAASQGYAVVEIEAWGAAGIGNVALGANGGVQATASTSYGPNFPADALIDGVTQGTDWGLAADGGWSNNGNGSTPDWAQLSFMNAQVVHAVTVWTLQDDYATGAAPDESTTFSEWGLTDFDVQAWNGNGWTTVASVTGNDLVKRTVTFAPVSTIMLRVVCNGGLSGYTRIVELQAWGIVAPLPPMLTALSSKTGIPGGTIRILGANFSVVPTADMVTFNGVAAVVKQASATSLTVTVPAHSTTGPVAVTVNGLTTQSLVNFSPSSGAQPNGAQVGPTITNFSPASGIVGSTVTVTGTGFGSTAASNTVTFNGVSASVSTASATSLTVVVPASTTGSVSGAIAVTVAGLTATSSGSFTELPSITSASPSSGNVGTAVNVVGAGFWAQGSTGGTIWFNGKQASYSNWLDTQIPTAVPSGASTGAITVTLNRGLSTTSAFNFTVAGATPTITGLSTTSGADFTTVTITGTNFSATATNNIVKFGGVQAPTPTAASTTSLTVSVPAGALTGAVTVTVGSQTATGPTFTVTAQAAKFISQSVPATMSAGGIYAVSVTIQNTGSATWTTAASYSLGSQNPQDNTTWGLSRVPLPSSVGPGQQATFSFNVTAPTTTGTTNFQWRVLQNGVAWFGDFSTNQAITITPPGLSVTSLSTTSGPEGSIFTINGTGFSTTPNNDSITFNGTTTTIAQTASATSMTVKVPTGAQTGPLTVTVGGQTVSAGTFTVTPAIVSFTPTSGIPPLTVQIHGTTFGTTQGTGTVTFTGGAFSLTSWSDTLIVGTLGSAASSGTFSVTTNARLSATDATPFQVTTAAPTITGLSTTSGADFTTVTIFGTNFSATATNDIVAFGGVQAPPPTAASTTSLTVSVPAGALTGAVTVTVGSQTATGPTFTVTSQAAKFISQSVPTTMAAGGTYAVSVTMQNTGSAAWTTAASYSLGSQNPQDNTTWGLGRVPLPSSVAPGQQATFSFNVTAPPTTGTTNFQWRVLQNGVAWFGDFSTNQAVTITPPGLSVTSLSATSGPEGSIFTINGTGFSTTPGNDSIAFNGTTTTIAQTASATSMTVKVPTGAQTGPLTVTVGGQAVSAGTFTVTPAITNFGYTPASGTPPLTVQIHGTTFGSAQGSGSVSYDGGGIYLVNTWSDTEIDVVLHAGATSGTFTVTTNSRTTTSKAFQIPTPVPTITGFTLSGASVAGAQIGQTITVVGTNFSAVASGNVVTFSNGVTVPAAQVTVVANGVQVVVPAGAVTGTVTVAVGSQTATSPVPFQIYTTAGLNAKFIGQGLGLYAIPSTMFINSQARVAVRMQNTGTAAWAAGGYVHLDGQYVTVAAYPWVTSDRVQLVSTVNPGDTVDIVFVITAPPIAQQFNFQWQMTADIPGGASTPFGDLSPATAISVLGNPVVPIGFPSTTNCSATAPPIVVGSFPGIPGYWTNPNRYGTGWQFDFIDQTPVAPGAIPALNVVWFTYDSTGRPVWLQGGKTPAVTQHDPTTQEDQYDLLLYWSTIKPPQTAVTWGDPVAEVAITFKQGSNVAAAVRWKWSSAGNDTHDECVYNAYNSSLIAHNGAPPPTSSEPDASYTGAWFAPSQAGWGLFSSFGFDDSNAYEERQVAAIYDVSGDPIWLMGTNATQSTGSTSIPLTYWISKYPKSFPTSDCSSAACEATYVNGANAVTRSYATSETGTASIAAAVPAGTASTGTAQVAWPNTGFPSGNVAIQKISDTNLILITPRTCVIPAGQSTCTVKINWSSAAPQSLVFRRNLNTNVLSTTPIFNSNSGNYQDTLSPGDHVLYEMHDGGVSTGSLLFTSADVTVVGSLTPPGPPQSVAATGSTDGTGTVHVSWTVPTTGTPTFYEVAYASSATGPWTLINGSLPVNPLATAFAMPNSLYFYGVAACNGPSSCSGYTSAVAKVTVSGVVASSGPPLPPDEGIDTHSDLPPHDATVGTMIGQASTDGGAAQYHVPIDVPPGRNGMQPNLALVYNSRSGNGVMGMGWTVAGLSSIHRCPQTPEQDGKALGVSYTASDKLCLDGQRLVTTTSTYGVSGAQYRTEVDSYAQITQVGGGLDSADTACFLVQQKDGRTLHYGGLISINTSDVTQSTCSTSDSTINARVKPAGSPAALSWLVQKVQDSVGNNQMFYYTNNGNGEVLVNAIKYTGYGSAAGDRLVSFGYTSRVALTVAGGKATDVSSSYLAGGLTLQTQALTSIATAVGTTAVRTYKPTYGTSTYSGRLEMTALQECSALTTPATCYPATTFTYNDGGLNYVFNPLTFGGAIPADKHPWSIYPIGDLDGDGSREYAILALSDSDTTNYAYVAQLAGDGTVRAVVDLTGTPFFYNYSYHNNVFADIDGDGRAKMMMIPAPGVDADGHTIVNSGTLSFAVWQGARGALLSTGATPTASFAANFSQVTTNIPVTSADQIFAQDMDGDGKLDIVRVTPDADCGGFGVYVYLNGMSTTLANASSPVSFATATTLPPNGTPSKPGLLFCMSSVANGGLSYTNQSIDHMLDFDGNGLPDFLINTSTTDTGAAATVGVYTTQLSVSGTTRMLSVTSVPCGPGTGAGTMGLTSAECSISIVQQSGGTLTGLARWMDVNGDGLEDFVTAAGSTTGVGGHWIVHLNVGGKLTSGIDAGSTYHLNDTTSNGSLRYANKVPAMDVDGDGMPDILLPTHAAAGTFGAFALKMCTMTQTVHIPDDPGACPEGIADTQSHLVGGSLPNTSECPVLACPEEPGSTTTLLPPNTSLEAGQNPYAWTDGNGSVLPAATLYGKFNGGPTDYSAYHMDMIKFEQTTGTGCSPVCFAAQTLTTDIVSALTASRSSPGPTDIGGNGLTSVISPLGCLARTYAYLESQGGSSYLFEPGCSVVGDGTYGPAQLPDGTTPASTFQPTAVAGASETFTMTGKLFSSVNEGVKSPSANATLAKSTTNTAFAVSGSNCPSSWVLPDLLTTSANGFGDEAVWGYDSLAIGFQCSRDGVPEYTIKNPNDSSDSGYADNRHYYFGSSMPVVSAMLQSNGIGGLLGARSAIYSYSEAIYNHLGRGFQGFRTITTENATDNTSSDKRRRLTTQTVFNQKFPLTGKVAGISVASPPSAGLGSHTVHTEVAAYQCTLLNNGSTSAQGDCPMGTSLFSQDPLKSDKVTGLTVFQPVLTTQTASEFDLGTGNASSHATTNNTAFTSYGDMTAQTVTHVDDSGSTEFIASHITTTTNVFAAADTVGWWVNQLQSNQVTADIAYTSGSTGHPVPSGAATGTPAYDLTLKTTYIWNSDRTLHSKTVQPQDASQESVATYGYPSTSYGLPNSSLIDAKALDSTTALSPLRYTTMAFSGDGYFVTGTSRYPSYVNSGNLGSAQTTTATYQNSDGQVTQATDLNGEVTTTTYDPFGRATLISYVDKNGAVIEPPMAMALTLCPSACAGEVAEETGPNEAQVATRMTTTQNGHPTTVTWFDLLGRSVKKASAGFSGTNGTTLVHPFAGSFTDYDEHGTVFSQSGPYFVGSEDIPGITGYMYDALKRVTSKSAPVSCSTGSMITTYTYSGRLTSIQVNGTCAQGTNGPIAMSRATNALGQLMQTTDANGKSTNYWTDPLGHVVAITDPESRTVLSTYNALGYRTQSNDPDQGIWSFTYDSLGELLVQTDARSVTTSVTARDALGRTLSQSVVPTAVVAPGLPLVGLDYESILDTFTYDATNGIGKLQTQTRYRGPSLTAPSSNPQVWQEQMKYDSASRLSGTSTTINEGTAVTFATSTTFDNAGRLQQIVYPDSAGSASGLTVLRSYTKYGQLNALSNPSATAGYVYWTAQGQNAWGHLIAETYPGPITGQHADWESTGQSQALTWSGTAADSVATTYDSFENVVSQNRATGGSNVTETYSYDKLQRLVQTHRNGAGDADVHYQYSDSGNIQFKDDYSIAINTTTMGYTYGGSGCGPHGVTSVALKGSGTATYTCDGNGNVVGGSTLSATFDAENRMMSTNRTPAGSVISQTGMTSWTYGSDGQMDTEVSSGQGATRYFGPSGYEQIGTGATATQKFELGPVVVTRVNNGSFSDTVDVVLRDRLGSTLSVIENGGTPTTRSYDAFGKARNADMSDRVNGILNFTDSLLGGLQTIHGFTQHDHADDVVLIHMGGRVYDYNLGRFLQVDPLIQNLANSQSLNPYSYIGNNPLSGTDPTGYSSCDVKQEIGSGQGQCKLDTGSDNKVYDGDKYLGKLNVNGSGTATGFAATQAGFAYLDAHSGATPGQTPHGEATPTGQPAHDASTIASSATTSPTKVNDAIQNQPYPIGVDPNSNLTLDQQSARWMAPGVGFVQCATGAAQCSDAETAKQAALIPLQLGIAKAIGFGIGKMAAWWAGDATGSAAVNASNAPLANVFDGHSPGQGFSGVYDSTTGNVLLRPSTTAAVIPDGWVARAGGHADVSAALGGNSANHLGFATMLQENGTLNMTWRSGSLNPAPNYVVPPALRPAIVDSVQTATGRTVNQ